MEALSAKPPVISIKGLGLSFEQNGVRTEVLRGLDLDVAPGEFVAIVGSSGVGKSTLLRVLMDIVDPTTGTVTLRPDATAERALSLVFQDARLLPWRRVLSNVCLGLEKTKATKAQRRERALAALTLVGLRDFADRWPYQLSGGQRQRVSLARALAVEPAILLMDEPFSALDVATRENLQDELIRIREKTGKTILFVTHDIDEAVSPIASSRWAANLEKCAACIRSMSRVRGDAGRSLWRISRIRSKLKSRRKRRRLARIGSYRNADYGALLDCVIFIAETMTTSLIKQFPIEVGLTAAIVAVTDDQPMILVARAGDAAHEAALPSGHFDPLLHRTLEIGLRASVSEQTGVPLGYVEQLYTFGDRGRHAQAGDRDPHVLSIGYLALTRRSATADLASAAAFRPWYEFFPWEDWRADKPSMIDAKILPALRKWSARDPDRPNAYGLSRTQRVRMLFGEEGGRFDEDNALDRYQLLYESGLVEEARRDGRASPLIAEAGPLGAPMLHDHRRILATAMGRLRAKMKYRPVIFELMPETFTLTALQSMAEALSGRRLHKQNFRRLVESTAVVEATGELSHDTGGRPAALFRFRREVLRERPAPGLRVGARG